MSVVLANASVLALLLPVAGFFVRLFAFAADPAIGSPARIALALGLGEMAFAGLIALAVTVPGLAIAALLFARDAARMHAIAQAADVVDDFKAEVDVRQAGLEADQAVRYDPAASSSWDAVELDQRIAEDRRLLDNASADLRDAEETLERARAALRYGRVVRVLGNPASRWIARLVAAVAVVLAPAFPAVLLLVFVAIAVFRGLSRTATTTGRLPLARSAPWLLIGMIGSGIFWGLSYPAEAAAEYTFDAGSAVPSGWYTRLGESADFAFLKACAGGEVLGVPSAAIQRVDFPQSSNYLRRLTGPSLLDVVTGRRQPSAGPSFKCP